MLSLKIVFTQKWQPLDAICVQGKLYCSIIMAISWTIAQWNGMFRNCFNNRKICDGGNYGIISTVGHAVDCYTNNECLIKQNTSKITKQLP